MGGILTAVSEQAVWGSSAMMIVKCWQNLNAEALADYGACDCRSQCQRKAELVNLLMDIADHRGMVAAANAAARVRQSWPGFASA